MSDGDAEMLPIIDRPLQIEIVDEEIVLNGLPSLAPSLTPAAARATAGLLVEAADQIEGLQER
jgi:hypothetical protein